MRFVTPNQSAAANSRRAFRERVSPRKVTQFNYDLETNNVIILGLTLSGLTLSRLSRPGSPATAGLEGSGR